MNLPVGTRLGIYEIVAPLGAGGMGEVYRARDTKLNRDVALKILPDAFTTDAERLARFRREAQVLASLNHPHIGQIYGFEDSGPTHALVMELVEGEDLSATIARGPVAIADALSIARQIADALEAAHEQGIVHRDLKPANIKVRADGTVKVLDFGLAKAMETGAASGPRNATFSPTLSVHATFAGVILGTAAYMSPEQARGKPVDRRTDIWAFGCVLYEMLAGRQTFDAGETVSDAIATILKGDVDWDALPADIPPHVRSILRRCLQKDPQRRIPHIGVVRLELDEPPMLETPPAAAATPVPVPPTRQWWRRAVPIAVAAIVAAAAAASVAWRVKPEPSRPVTRFSIALGEGQDLPVMTRQQIAISPDGRMIAYGAGRRIYVRALADTEARPLSGTDSSSFKNNVVFSPDSQSIAYADPLDLSLKRIAVTGGASLTVCPLENSPFGMHWYRGAILFEQAGRGIFRVSENGGTPELIVPMKAGELMHGPQMLPDDDTVLYTFAAGNSGSVNATWDGAQIVGHSLKTAQRKTLVQGGMEGRYLPTGHIVYAVRGVLFAVPFDLARLLVTGGPVPLVQGVTTFSSTVHYSVSDSGSLVYLPGQYSTSIGQLDLALIDAAKATSRALKLPAGQYETPRVSPDGTRAAFGVDDGKEQMVWVYDLSGATAMRRLTFGGRNRYPVWSPDSQRIAFQSDRDGDIAIFSQRADGTGTAERLTRPEKDTGHEPDSWSPDGKVLLYEVVQGRNTSLWTLALDSRTATAFGGVRNNNPISAMFSPDGRWVAYQSNETGGGSQIFVQPFPANGTKYQISKTETTNAHHPLWSRAGKQLFFIPGRGQFSVVSINTASGVAVTNPTSLPRGVFGEGGPSTRRNYDVTADGQLLAVVPAGQADSGATRSSQIQVVLNWFDELKQRVPAK